MSRLFPRQRERDGRKQFESRHGMAVRITIRQLAEALGLPEDADFHAEWNGEKQYLLLKVDCYRWPDEGHPHTVLGPLLKMHHGPEIPHCWEDVRVMLAPVKADGL